MSATGACGSTNDNPPMKTPARLQSLQDEGFIDSVQRQLMSGKEATVYVVRCGDETRCAKVYKEATHRSFRQAVDYTENRKVKNSRQARAMYLSPVTLSVTCFAMKMVRSSRTFRTLS